MNAEANVNFILTVLSFLSAIMSKDNSDRMSSVSNSSKFSVKSQQVIVEQNVTIAEKDDTILEMRSLLIKAVNDPDAIQTQAQVPASTSSLSTLERMDVIF